MNRIDLTWEEAKTMRAYFANEKKIKDLQIEVKDLNKLDTRLQKALMEAQYEGYNADIPLLESVLRKVRKMLW